VLRFDYIKSVMIVDDDPFFIDYVTGILENKGFRVRSVSNCLDALYAVSDDVPDLFLISLVMPTISGDRLCKVLSSQPQLAGSYRVMLSAMANEAEMDLEAIGAHACIAKAPWKSIPANLFSVLQQLDQSPNLPYFDEELKFQNQKKVLKDKLRHAQKMEAVGMLSGGIAHDFNNTLQAILGYAQLSLFESDIPPTVRSYLEEIQGFAQKATSLIRRLLVFSRKVDSQHQPVDLNQQISQVCQMLERTIPRMVRIEHQLNAELKLIQADGNLLEQILINLGVNARDAMPEGGCLKFETRNIVLDEIFCASHPGANAGEYVKLTVSDTGTGMTDDVREHIFDPFFTTKKDGQGTGLGLAMAYGIVKDHAGFITCDSAPGQGTKFSLYFPVIETRDEYLASQPEQRDRILIGKETILLVDDERRNP
jgi:signal transduction histidine kinase